MGTVAIKKDRRDKSSKGAVLRTNKTAVKAEKPSINPKAKKPLKPAKVVKAVKGVKAGKGEKKPLKIPPIKAVAEKKTKISAPIVEVQKAPKELAAKKQAAPKKAQTGKVTMAGVESSRKEAQAVRSIIKSSEPYKIKEGHCPNCSIFGNCRRRDFSEQAMTVLLLWGEIAVASVDQAICDDCYEELREVLIDRADEVDTALSGKGVDRVREMISRAAS